MTGVGEALYFEVGSEGDLATDQGRWQLNRGRRLTKRSLRRKAPWVRPIAVAFASGCRRRPYQASHVTSVRGKPGELILPGFRKESSEGLVSGQSSFADVFQDASDIRERQKVPGSIDLG